MDKKILITTNMFSEEQLISIVDTNTGTNQLITKTTMNNLTEDALKTITEYGIYDVWLVGSPDVVLDAYRQELYNYAQCNLTYSYKPIKIVLEGEI